MCRLSSDMDLCRVSREAGGQLPRYKTHDTISAWWRIICCCVTSSWLGAEGPRLARLRTRCSPVRTAGCRPWSTLQRNALASPCLHRNAKLASPCKGGAHLRRHGQRASVHHDGDAMCLAARTPRPRSRAAGRQVDRVAPLAAAYVRVGRFVSLRQHYEFGLVNHALCSVLQVRPAGRRASTAARRSRRRALGQ